LDDHSEFFLRYLCISPVLSRATSGIDPRRPEKRRELEPAWKLAADYQQSYVNPMKSVQSLHLSRPLPRFSARLRTQVTYNNKIQILLVKLSVIISALDPLPSLFTYKSDTQPPGGDQCNERHVANERLNPRLVSEPVHGAPNELLRSTLSNHLLHMPGWSNDVDALHRDDLR
jgi:hypothetical protein